MHKLTITLLFIAFYAYLVTCIIPNRSITFAPAPSPIPIQYLIRSWSRTVIKSSPRACKSHERNQTRIEIFYFSKKNMLISDEQLNYLHGREWCIIPHIFSIIFLPWQVHMHKDCPFTNVVKEVTCDKFLKI